MGGNKKNLENKARLCRARRFIYARRSLLDPENAEPNNELAISVTIDHNWVAH